MSPASARRARTRRTLAIAAAMAVGGCGGSLTGGEAAETVCDGVDNDRDDVVDDGFACALGAERPCTLAGTACVGSQLCVAGCTWSPCEDPSWACTSPGDLVTCTAHDSCAGTATCQDDCSIGTCTDPGWQCTDPGSSDDTCLVGACPGTRDCAADCTFTACAADCPLGESCCDDGCADLATDGDHCGACQRACDDGACHAGACCVESCRNGSEVCDDQAFAVPSPYVTMRLVCRNDAGGVAYVATNTGPAMEDGIQRCQGWEAIGEDAWDHLDYIATLICNTTGQSIVVDLSDWAGEILYVGAHDLPTGGGHMTDVCIAEGAS